MCSDMAGLFGLFMMRTKFSMHRCVQCGSTESLEPILVFESSVLKVDLVAVY